MPLLLIPRPSTLQLQQSAQPVEEQQIIIEDASGMVQQEEVEQTTVQVIS